MVVYYKHRSEKMQRLYLFRRNECMMLNKVTETAEFYTRRFVDYMGFYSQDYSLSTIKSTNGEMYR